ncbi:MAG: glycosyltransferase family 1 protein [Bacteroidota bacterium]
MPAKYLHIIAFNIPFPADYGGVIDIYYKLKALKQAGIQIILHCYAYGRQQSKELEDLCFKVHYYHRNSGLKYFLSRDPYIVSTRNANTMPKNIFGDHFPVLFEGLHSTALLPACAAAGKQTIVRAHNIEHRYYRSISRSETRLFNKLFLYTEAVKLKPYEAVLKHADHILGISKSETTYFEKAFGQAHFIPAFHRFEEVNIEPGTGGYILFHGNLGVPENSDVFLRIGQHVLSKTTHRIVVAGKNPLKQFLRKVSAWSNVEVIANPSDDEMDLLIRNAQVNLLYTAQATGIKLKLLHSLFGGRHCLVNREMVEGTGLDHLCRQADRPDEMISSLEELMELPFTAEQINERKATLQDYSNRAGAEKILRLLR